MSPSDRYDETPPEVLAIAVALAALWPGAELAVDGPLTAPRPSGSWRWGDRRWSREAIHRWS